MRIPQFLCAAGLVIGCLTSQATIAQDREPRFFTNVNAVQIDVSVLDRDRRMVSGLTAKDFTVYEDNRRQDILNFAEINLGSASAATPGPDATPTNENPGTGRLIVILLDDAEIRPDSRMVMRAKGVARSILSKLAPADVASVVFIKDNRNAVDLTTDRKKLLSAVDAFSPSYTGAMARPIVGDPVSQPDAVDEHAARISLNVLEAIVGVVGKASTRRKALFFVSVGVPFAGRQSTQMERLFTAAQRTNVNIYPIDPSGVTGVQDIGVAESGSPVARPSAAREDYLRILADNTAGLAVVGRNNFETALSQIFSENQSYYLIQYQSTNQRADGSFRKIKVEVSRPAVTVRTRSGYTAPSSSGPTR